MRTLHFITLFTILSYLISCTNSSNTYPTTMQKAEYYMNTRPDSALTLLHSMEDSIQEYSKETQIYWHLLTIQAKDKQYIVHTSDTLINHIVKFYEGYGDDNRLMLAYYYQGRVYRDMNDAPRALKAFQQAEKIRSSDWELKTKIYSQMGYLFSYQGLHDEAILVNRKAIKLYTQQGKEAQSSYAWRDIARMYDLKGIKDSACVYYEKACDVAMINNDSTRYVGVLSELACLYYEFGKQDTAKQMLLAMVENPRIRNKSNIYSYLGNIYTNSQDWDSAFYYHSKAIETGDIHKKCANVFSLALLERKRGREIQALRYMEEALWLNDSIRRIIQTEAIAKINSLYNYQRTETENAHLLLDKERYEKMILVVVLIALVAVGGCFYLVMGWRKERRRYQENERKLHEWQEYARLKWELQQLRSRELQLAGNEQELAVKELRNSEVYRLFRRISLGEEMKVEAKNWTELRKEINKVYPHFLANIQEMYPKMSLVETRICLLAKIGMTSTQIARVLGYSKSGIASSRSRLYKKIFNVEGTAELFDEFIKAV